jgi:hypothetical protein
MQAAPTRPATAYTLTSPSETRQQLSSLETPSHKLKAQHEPSAGLSSVTKDTRPLLPPTPTPSVQTCRTSPRQTQVPLEANGSVQLSKGQTGEDHEPRVTASVESSLTKAGAGTGTQPDGTLTIAAAAVPSVLPIHQPIPTVANRTTQSTHVRQTSTTPKQVQFDKINAEKIGRGNLFIDRTISIDANLLLRWRVEIQPKIDDDMKKLVKNWLSGDNISLVSQFYMVGKKQGDSLLVQPTIIILCDSKRCKSTLSKEFPALQLHYLDNFTHNIKVCYQGVAWAMTSEEGESVVNNAMSTASLRNIRIENEPRLQGTNCGQRLRFEVGDLGSAVYKYATLGGTVSIESRLYGLTTAHTFVADLVIRDLASSDDESFASTDSDSDTEKTLQRSKV